MGNIDNSNTIQRKVGYGMVVILGWLGVVSESYMHHTIDESMQMSQMPPTYKKTLVYKMGTFLKVHYVSLGHAEHFGLIR